MLEINIKMYLEITHTFCSAMWHLSRESFEFTVETLSKIRRLKKTQRVIAEKKTLKWEVDMTN